MVYYLSAPSLYRDAWQALLSTFLSRLSVSILSQKSDVSLRQANRYVSMSLLCIIILKENASKRRNFVESIISTSVWAKNLSNKRIRRYIPILEMILNIYVFNTILV